MSKSPTIPRVPKEPVRIAEFCFALTATLLLFKVIVSAQNPAYMFPEGILSVLMVALCMLATSMLNDFFCGSLGEKLLSAIVFIGCALAPLGYAFFGFHPAFLPLMVIGIAVSIVLWGKLLSSLDHQYLYFVSSSAFIFAGFTIMFSLDINDRALLIIIAGYYAIALICERVYKKNQADTVLVISAEESAQRNITGRGNRSTIFTIGLVSGISIYILACYDFGFTVMPFIFGGILALCALTVLLAGRRYQTVFEDSARRSLALCTALALLPLPFVPPAIQLICIAVLFFSAGTNLIILTNAIAETARKKCISPLWLFGTEGSVFVLGLWAGIAGFYLAVFNNLSGNGLAAICVLTVVMVIIMQVFIENQSYPFFDENASTPSRENDDYCLDERQFAQKGGAIWHNKLARVAEVYNLSPRQSEVMGLLAKGRDAKYIMDYFVVSRSTAKTHTYNLYKKLGIHSRQELLDLIERTSTHDPAYDPAYDSPLG